MQQPLTPRITYKELAQDSIPRLNRFLGVSLGILIITGLAGSTGKLDNYNYTMMLAGIIQVLVLIFVDPKGNAGFSYTRIGFHVGIFGYLLSLPLLLPDKLEVRSETVRNIAALCILVGIVGFEAGFWLLRKRSQLLTSSEFILEGKSFKRCVQLMWAGILMYVIYVLYVMSAFGVPFTDVIFNMRGAMKFNAEEVVWQADALTSKVIGHVFQEGRILAASAAYILLLSKKGKGVQVPYLPCYYSFGVALLAGFYDGSRAVFAYMCVPTACAIWIILSRYPNFRQLRAVYVIVAFVTVMITWAVMTELRGKDIDTRTFNWENTLKFYEYFSGAAVYSDYELVIGSFYETEKFQYGRSLIPLFLGWVPRFMWPDKPLPFTQVVNEVRGISLNEVSLASSILGEGYGNFGIIGVLFWTFGLGIFAAFIDNFAEGFRSGNIFFFPLKCFQLVWVAQITRGGVPEMFYMGLFPIGLTYIMIYLTSPPKKNLALQAFAWALRPTSWKET